MVRKGGTVWFHGGEVLFNLLLTHVPWHALRKGWLRALGATIGSRSSVLRGTTVLHARGIVIGDHVSIGFRCMLDGRGTLTIRDNVVIASDTHFMAGGHDITDPGFPATTAPVVVEDYVWIASRATVMAGVTLGRGAVVAGCAAVTTDVAPLTVVGGVPAKPIGERPESALAYTIDFHPWFF